VERDADRPATARCFARATLASQLDACARARRATRGCARAARVGTRRAEGQVGRGPTELASKREELGRERSRRCSRRCARALRIGRRAISRRPNEKLGALESGLGRAARGASDSPTASRSARAGSTRCTPEPGAARLLDHLALTVASARTHPISRARSTTT
jgi:hypothetical protein